MADANKDYLESANDMVPRSDGGGPFQVFGDVPGMTSKDSGTLAPDADLARKRRPNGNGSVSSGGLAGR